MSSMYYIVSFFVFGLLFGSFFNVVGYRLPHNESIIFPPSHCPKCKRRLSALELIPVFSYIFLFGRCKDCKETISLRYPIFEILTGILFAASYMVFGLSVETIISLTFVSALIIIIISDLHAMTIPDEIIIIGSAAILIEKIIFYGYDVALTALGNGLLALLLMLLIKLLGDVMFKRESLGGGDIKLMFLIGTILEIKLSIIVIIVGAFITLPYALFVLFYRKTHIVSFGPFLSLAGIILYLTKWNFYDIFNYFITY